MYVPSLENTAQSRKNLVNESYPWLHEKGINYLLF